MINNTKTIVINLEEYGSIDDYKNKYQYCASNYDDIFSNLLAYINKCKQKYENNKRDKKIFKDIKKIQVFIIGIEFFKEKVSDENKKIFPDLFNDAKDLDIISFILVDRIDKIKKIEIEQWFKNCSSTDNFIWVGNGITEQFV
ncbi:MAG: hypothetical protein ACK5HP_00370 [Bacilli bacterium]